MIDPNVPSYFLIILCGFGAVWSFRKSSGRKNSNIHEFEYVAFSTLWGSVIFLPVLINLSKNPTTFDLINQFPFIATPLLFIFGAFLGWLSSYLEQLYSVLKLKIKSGKNHK